LISHLPIILLFGLVFSIGLILLSPSLILLYVCLIGLFQLVVQFHLVYLRVVQFNLVLSVESMLIVCLWSTIYGVFFFYCYVSRNSAHNLLVWFRSGQFYLVSVGFDWIWLVCFGFSFWWFIASIASSLVAPLRWLWYQCVWILRLIL
jgi:hypothetical protein